jgi:hypothetical protein
MRGTEREGEGGSADAAGTQFGSEAAHDAGLERAQVDDQPVRHESAILACPARPARANSCS